MPPSHVPLKLIRSHACAESDLDDNTMPASLLNALGISTYDSQDHSMPYSDRDKDNLGDVPEVQDSSCPEFLWTPSWPQPTLRLPPVPKVVDQQILELKDILHPRCNTGYGSIDPELNHTLCTHLAMMLHFLCIYQLNGYQHWINSSAQVATLYGWNILWTARRLHEWTHAFAQDKTGLPNHQYGKWHSSVLEDEDLSQEICLHLKYKGLYICAIDIVHFLQTPVTSDESTAQPEEAHFSKDGTEVV